MIIRTLVATVALGAAAAGVCSPAPRKRRRRSDRQHGRNGNVQAVAVAEMDTLGAGLITPANITSDLESNPVDRVTTGPSTSATVFSVAGSSDPIGYPGAGVAIMGGTGCQAAWVDANDQDLLAIDESPVITFTIPAGRPCQAPALPPRDAR
jgi:hypothetical protein